jgi:hypothetical protein
MAGYKWTAAKATIGRKGATRRKDATRGDGSRAVATGMACEDGVLSSKKGPRHMKCFGLPAASAREPWSGCVVAGVAGTARGGRTW